MTIKEALIWSNKLLIENGVEGPRASAEFLLRQVMGVRKEYLISYPEKKLNIIQERKFKNWINKRAKHEPVWYIAGKIEFFEQDFYVNKNVLIPRPETEIILEKIIRENKGIKGKKILDLGTGSGAIILTLVKWFEAYYTREHVESKTNKACSSHYRSNNKYFASDLSEAALTVAKKNAKNLFPPSHSLKSMNPVVFRRGDLFGPWVDQKFDIIVANLPYVPHEDMSTLAFDLTHYEPRLALDGGEKGLVVYDRFFSELPDFVTKDAKIYCEIGHDQGQAVINMAKKSFPEAIIELERDYASKDRLVIIRLGGKNGKR